MTKDENLDRRGPLAAIAGATAIYSIASLTPPAVSLLVTPIVTRLLSASEYGAIAVVLVVVQVSSILVALGLPAAITRQSVMEVDGADRARATFRWTTWVALGVASLSGTGVVIAFSTGRSRVEELAAVVAGGLLCIITCALALFRGLERPGMFVIVASAASIAGQGCALVGALVEGTARAYVLGLVIGYAVVAALAVALASSTGGRSGSRIRRQLAIGLPTVPHQLAFYLSTGALVLVAAHRLGLREAGALHIALLVGMTPSLLLNAINNSWSPMVYRRPDESRGQLLTELAGLVAWTMAATSLVVALVSPVVCGWLAPNYGGFDLPRATSIVALGSLLAVWYLSNAQLVFASGRTSALAVLTPASLAMTTAIAAVLSETGSVVVMATSLVAFYGSQGVLMTWYAKKVTAIRWREFVVFAPIATGALGIGLSMVIDEDGDALVVRVLLAAGVVALLITTGARKIRLERIATTHGPA